jgi:hypothetical protein
MPWSRDLVVSGMEYPHALIRGKVSMGKARRLGARLAFPMSSSLNVAKRAGAPGAWRSVGALLQAAMAGGRGAWMRWTPVDRCAQRA